MVVHAHTDREKIVLKTHTTTGYEHDTKLQVPGSLEVGKVHARISNILVGRVLVGFSFHRSSKCDLIEGLASRIFLAAAGFSLRLRSSPFRPSQST